MLDTIVMFAKLYLILHSGQKLNLVLTFENKFDENDSDYKLVTEKCRKEGKEGVAKDG